MSEQMNPRYIVGIDLGTTHCVLAYMPGSAAGENGEPATIQIFAIPQLVNAGEVEARPLMPSFLLLPGEHDVAPGALTLPWHPEGSRPSDGATENGADKGARREAVGEFARKRGAELPARLVASAKSWLCTNSVDRQADILPWHPEGSRPPNARRVSPVEATTRYLAHLRAAWNHVMAADGESARLEEQEIYLTVPASFDPVARELTVQAAQAAGLPQATLLEEPQAAFYAWLAAQGESWRDQVQVGESILVCDVGGGTTDFSLIQVGEEEGALNLRRVAVGDHILLGGDNMDLTLAYAVRAKLAQQGTELDNWQFRSLWYSCRQAKERLLNDPERMAEPVVVLGRGTSLIGGTIRTELTREEIESILVSGFFPLGAADEFPQRKPQVGMREMGLPYAADPAITRHLAYFLHRQVDAAQEEGVAFPSAVLFNGGVMKAEPLRKQVLEALQTWHTQGTLRELPSVDLDRAVAMGAVYYGRARRGEGIRIRAGTARSYYIGIESAMPAVPGIPTPMKALCVVPFGMEEGAEMEISDREFGLVVGENAVFHFLSASTRKEDYVGQVVDDWRGEIQEVAALETYLPASDEEEGGTVIPVWLQIRVQPRQTASAGATAEGDSDRLSGVELGAGVLEIWCIERDGDREWRLEFDVSYHPT